MFKNKYRFDGAVEKVRVLQSEITHGIFEEVIRPVLRKNNWTMRWGMGSVMILNAKGKEILRGEKGSGIIEKLEEEVQTIFDNLPTFNGGGDLNALWWIMSYIYPDGKYEDDVLSPWED